MNKKLFGMRLRAARKGLGFKSQEDFAESYNRIYCPDNDTGSGVLGTIKKYEAASYKTAPNLEIVMNICEMLGCDIDYLCGRRDKYTKDFDAAQRVTGLSYNSLLRLYREKELENSDFKGLSHLAQLANIINYACDRDGADVVGDGELSDIESALANLFWAVINYDEDKERQFFDYQDTEEYERMNLYLSNRFGAGVYQNKMVLDLQRNKAIDGAKALITNFIDDFCRYIKQNAASGAGSTESGNDGQNEAPAL